MAVCSEISTKHKCNLWAECSLLLPEENSEWKNKVLNS